MKVRAIYLGFYGGLRRYPGDVFEFHGQKLGSWMEPADKAAAAADDPAPAPSPDTMSGLNREHDVIERKVLRKKGADHAG